MCNRILDYRSPDPRLPRKGRWALVFVVPVAILMLFFIVVFILIFLNVLQP
jgi:hypothetical protein